LSIKLNYHHLCNTSMLYTACIPYAVFVGHCDGGVLSVLSIFSLLLMLTVKLFVGRVHKDDQCKDEMVRPTRI